MNIMQNETTKKITTGLIVLAVLLIVVYLFGSSRFLNGFRRNFRSAEMVSEVVREMFRSVSVTSLSGTVGGIADNSITMEVPSMLGVTIPSDADLFIRTVRISPETKITERVWRSEAELAAAMREYRARGGSGMPPEPFVLRNLSLSDLIVGDRISVTAGGEDLKDVLEISAREITRIQN